MSAPYSSPMLRAAPLSRAETDALLAKYADFAKRYGPNSRRATKVRNTLISTNMRLVASIASRYRLPTEVEFDDLLSAGCFGLAKAIERFDLARGYAFSTYASWWIRHALNRDLADTAGSLVRIPVHMQETLSRQARGEDAEKRHLADAQAARRVTSLDAPIDTEEWRTTWVEQTPHPECIDPTDAHDADVAARRVADEIQHLPGKLREVICGRMADRTLSEIGADYERGSSRERIRQLEREAHDLLRPRLKDVADLASP